MKSPIIATALFMLAASQSASAETCQEKFVRLLIDGNGDGPVKILSTQQIKGGMTSKNYFYQVAPGHWMTEVISPANQPWVLTYDNTMYTSSDKGTSWKKLRTVDSAQNQRASKTNLTENAKTVKNAVCSTEEIAGVTYDTVEADYQTLQNFKTENHHKYWVDPKSGFISKATYQMKGKGFESLTTQLIETASDLKLPTPH